MTVPKWQVGQAYFLRKLNNMNLTIYDMPTDQAHCYLWDASSGQKGTNEVFTSIHKWLGDIDIRGTAMGTVVIWSYSTDAQKRNKYMCAGRIHYI